MVATAFVVDLANVFDKVQLNVVWRWGRVLAGMSLVCASRSSFFVMSSLLREFPSAVLPMNDSKTHAQNCTAGKPSASSEMIFDDALLWD